MLPSTLTKELRGNEEGACRARALRTEDGPPTQLNKGGMDAPWMGSRVGPQKQCQLPKKNAPRDLGQGRKGAQACSQSRPIPTE